MFIAVPDSTTLLSCIAVGTIASWLGWCVYCLWFHPLAKYPGPRLAAFSQIWYTWAWTSGHYPSILEDAHRRYGDVVRIAPNELSFATIQAHRDIYAAPSKSRKLFPKSGTFYTAGDATNVFFELDSAKHAKMHKMLAPGFRPAALKAQEHVIHRYVDLLVDKVGRLSDEGSGGVDMAQVIPWLTFDIMGELTFGESFGALAAGKTHFWISILQDGVGASSLPGLVKRTPLAYLIAPFMMPRDAFENRRKHRAYSLEVLRRRMNRPRLPPSSSSSSSYDDGKEQDDHDLFAPLLQDPEASEEVLLSQAWSLVIAGADTVSVALTAALWFLCAPPAYAMDALRTEVRALPYDQLTDAALAHLPYLNAVIEETLRLFPPVPFGLPRVVPGTEREGDAAGAAATVVIDGLAVPGGTEVSVPHWVINRRPDVWGPRSAEFAPERWLVGDDGRRPVTFPFSAGPRACIGITQAYLEMRITLAKLVHAYDFRLADGGEATGGDWVKDSRMYFLWKKAPLRVRFTRRREDWRVAR